MSSRGAIEAKRIEPLGVAAADAGVQEKRNGPRTLRESVLEALDDYFEHLDGQPATDLYELVIAEVEAPLLESVLRVTRNNQTRCAAMLGLNRGTLRKKLKKYGLL